MEISKKMLNPQFKKMSSKLRDSAIKEEDEGIQEESSYLADNSTNRQVITSRTNDSILTAKDGK